MIKKRTAFFLTLIMIALLFGYIFYDNKPVVIVTLKADLSETKRRPKERGGIIIANSDSLIYETSNKSKRKIILSPDPEQPIKIISKKMKQAQIIYSESIDDILNNIEYYEELYNKEDFGQEASDDIILPNILSPREIVSNKTPILMFKNTNLEIAKSSQKRFEFNIAKRIYDNSNKNYKIQLTASYSENNAKSQWEKIKKRYSKILVNSNLILEKSYEEDGKIFYFVMSGPYSTLSKAQHICRKLISQSQHCIVKK